MDFYSTESPPITLAIPISQPSVVTDELILLTYTGWDVLTDLLEP